MKYKNIDSKRLVLLVDGNLRVIDPGEILEATKVFPNPSLVNVSDFEIGESKIVKNLESTAKSEPAEKVKKVVERHAKKKDKLEWHKLESQD